MNNKMENKIIIGLISLIVVLCISWIALRIHNVGTINENKILEKQVEKKELEYNTKSKRKQFDYLKNHINDSNYDIQALARLNVGQNSLQKISDNFFSIYYTFDNGKDYESRANRLAPVIDEKVKKDTKIFDSGKDIDGRSMVDVLGLSSKLTNVDAYIISNDGNKIEGIVRADYTASYKNGTSGSGYSWYGITYNSKENKITELKFLQKAVYQ